MVEECEFTLHSCGSAPESLLLEKFEREPNRLKRLKVFSKSGTNGKSISFLDLCMRLCNSKPVLDAAVNCKRVSAIVEKIKEKNSRVFVLFFFFYSQEYSQSTPFEFHSLLEFE